MKDRFVITGIVLGIVFFVVLILGQHLDHPLVSYDEAWYGSIARDMVVNGNMLFQRFNGTFFYDHPPMGFWLMAISIRLFGDTEFSVRLPSMIAGCLSFIFIYLLARRRSNTWFGLTAVIMLASSLWFVYRIRSGNMDALLACFFLSTYYFAESWFVNGRSRICVIGTIVSMAGLLLTKTLVGFGIFPALMVAYFVANKNRRPSLLAVSLALVGVGVLCLPWYWFNYLIHPNFLYHHFIGIGMRDGVKNITVPGIQQTLLYLRSGIGRWYYPVIASMVTTMGLLFNKRLRQHFLITDFVLVLTIGIPFFTSPKTEVWHLIPLYAPLFLVFTSVWWILIHQLSRPKIIYVCLSLLMVVITTVGVKQGKAVFSLMTQHNDYDEVDISKKAKFITMPIYFNGTFLPAFIYYSNQQFVDPLWLHPHAYQKMTQLLTDPFFWGAFIVKSAEVESLTNDKIPFRIYAENQNYTIIMSTSDKERI